MVQVGRRNDGWMLMVKQMKVRGDPHLLQGYQDISNERIQVNSRFDDSRYRPMLFSHQSRP